MRSLLFPVLAACAAASLGSCGGAQAVRRIPNALADRCLNVQREVIGGQTKGKHTAITVRWRAGDSAIDVDESQLAERIAAGRGGGQTWVLARGGSGKSRLVDAVQSANCDRVATVRVDAALEFRPAAEMATAKRPALALIVAEKVGAAGEGPIGERLADALGKQPWLLLVDGTDELTPAERCALDRDIAWLARQPMTQPHVVRFERPGFTDPARSQPPEAVVEVPELTCEAVDAAVKSKFAAEDAHRAARAFLTQFGLDRRRGGLGPCRYAHLATWRDVELAADLAADASKGLDPPPEAPNRADLYATWLGHRLNAIAPGTDAAMRWLDRLLAVGVQDAAEPDLLLTLDRCANVAAPGSAPVIEACAALMKSAVVKSGPTATSWILRNQTLTDLLLARWVVAKTEDCNLMAATTADLASLELTAMVLSQVPGRRCLVPIIAAVCSRGTPADDIGHFVDEALPRDGQWQEFVDRAKERASSPCEREVMARVMAPVAP
ncbi:MAG: hypothetical protein FJ100_20550 [Deltaproteobacteria bacterium]|nr:hypothetical protein [Deltaproteobacteria bacterium]